MVRKDPALTEAELLAHCKQHLTGYKMPRIVEFRSEPLPKASDRQDPAPRAARRAARRQAA
ncbi:MAG: hypothetical protein MZW92_35085 [Comamonadaceae bacterium]|nr:hypothetical protein [Comamonadaceae bacterium]